MATTNKTTKPDEAAKFSAASGVESARPSNEAEIRWQEMIRAGMKRGLWSGVSESTRLARAIEEQNRRLRFVLPEVVIKEPKRAAKPHSRSTGRVLSDASPMAAVISKVREWRKEGLSHREICSRLHDSPRPPSARWAHLKWPAAYRNQQYTKSVKKWISTNTRN